MNIVYGVVLLLSLTATSWGIMQYTDCGSTATIHFVIIEQCTHDPCVLHKGHNYTILVNFTPHKTHNEVHSYMSLTSPLHADIPVPVWTNYECGDIAVQCPIKPGLLQTYSANFIGPYYSEVNIDIKWEINDERNNPIVCFVLAELVQN